MSMVPFYAGYLDHFKTVFKGSIWTTFLIDLEREVRGPGAENLNGSPRNVFWAVCCFLYELNKEGIGGALNNDSVLKEYVIPDDPTKISDWVSTVRNRWETEMAHKTELELLGKTPFGFYNSALMRILPLLIEIGELLQKDPSEESTHRLGQLVGECVSKGSGNLTNVVRLSERASTLSSLGEGTQAKLRE